MAQRSKLPGSTPEVLSATLSKTFGSQIMPEMIEADIQSGAPVNPDGTIPLMRYIAWLLKQEADGRS